MPSWREEVLTDLAGATAGMVLTFTEASGNILDKGAGAHDAVPSGSGNSYRVTGPHATGMPYAFRVGSSGLLTITHHADLNFGDGPGTFGLVLKRTAGDQVSFLNKGDGATTPGYEIWGGGGNQLALSLGEGSKNVQNLTPDADSSAFHFWVWTRGTSTSGNVYRDGVVDTHATNRTFTDNTRNLLIGDGGHSFDIAGAYYLKGVTLSGARALAQYAGRLTADSTPVGATGLAPYIGGGFFP